MTAAARPMCRALQRAMPSAAPFADEAHQLALANMPPGGREGEARQ